MATNIQAPIEVGWKGYILIGSHRAALVEYIGCSIAGQPGKSIKYFKTLEKIVLQHGMEIEPGAIETPYGHEFYNSKYDAIKKAKEIRDKQIKQYRESIDYLESDDYLNLWPI